MALIAEYTAEGGTNGAAVAAGGSGSGNAWDAVVNTSAVITYDNTHVDYGSLAIKVAMLSAVCRVAWTSATLGTRTELWYAGDFYFTGSPTSSCHVVEGVTSGAAQAWAVDIASTGHFFVRNTANANVYTSTASIPVNTWCRIEVHYVAGAPGTLQVWLYASHTDPLGSHLETSGVLSTNTGSDTSSLYVGAMTSSTALPAYWAGDQRVGDAAGGQLGPLAGSFTDSAAMVAATTFAAAPTVMPSGGAAMVSGTSLAAVPVATLHAAATMASATSLSGSLASPITARLLDGLTKWVAHRNGYWATFGQGTLEGYQAAVTQYSKAFLELPVRQCSTGEWVVIHDPTTSPAFAGPTVSISATSWSALSGYVSAAGGNPIRRLTDILDAFPGQMFVVDNKQDTNHANLIGVLEAHASGRWMGKAWYTASGTWLTACQNAGVPVWLFFYPADLDQLPTPLTNLSASKSLILYGLGDYSAAPVPVQSDANTFWAFTSAHGIPSWADIINSSAQRSNADAQATSTGNQFAGYMVSNFAAVAPTDSPAAAMTSGTSLAATDTLGASTAAAMTSASALAAGPALGVPLAAGMASVTEMAASAALVEPAAAGMTASTVLAGSPSVQQPDSAALVSVSALAGAVLLVEPATAALLSGTSLGASPAGGSPGSAGMASRTVLTASTLAQLADAAGMVSVSTLVAVAELILAGGPEVPALTGPALVGYRSGPSVLPTATGPAAIPVLE